MSYKLQNGEATLYEWDHENRLSAVKRNGATIESYLYDDGGQRIKKTAGGVDTYYVNQFYEVSGGVATKYYYFGGQRIAMRKNGTLTYLHSDHLGSTVLETNSRGNATADQKYFAYGRQRDAGPVTTDHKFTGQKSDATGLMYYQSRYYDPAIGTFISPDTIVPDATNVFDYNRHMYVRGRVFNYNDPTGHCPVCVIVGIGSKILDYGWTAWDTVQSGWTIADPNATRDEKLLAGLNIGLAAVTEAVEPDDWFPIGLPADDVARRTLMKGASEALEAGGESGLRKFIRNNLGDTADDIFAEIDKIVPIFGMDELSKGAQVADRNGLTKAGRALQKHSNRPGSVYGKPAGKLNPANYNQAGQEIVDDILTAPGSTTWYGYRNGYGYVYEVYSADGRRLRFDSNGVLSAFLEP